MGKYSIRKTIWHISKLVTKKIRNKMDYKKNKTRSKVKFIEYY